jgi:signal transduction histidine kinase
VTLAVASPVVAALLLASADALRPGLRYETPCWLLPNLRALPTPISPDCPLKSYDVIRGIRHAGGAASIDDLPSLGRTIAAAEGPILLDVRSGGRQRWVELPVRTTDRRERAARLLGAGAAAAFFLALPLSVIWRTNSSAARPLAGFYTAFTVLLIGLLAGRQSPALTLGSLTALTLGPATLFHLGLRFPRDRPIAVDYPIVCRIPYLASAFLFGLGCIALRHEPLTWPAFVLVLVLLASLGWIVLIASCAFAMRESTSPLERARSRVVAYGSALLPVLPILALLAFEGLGERDLGVLYLWAAAATMPLPIGLAISRYNLFDLGLDIRQAIGRTLYLGIATLAIAAVLWTFARRPGLALPSTDPATLLGVSLLCALILEPLRRRVPELLESTLAPRLETLARHRARFAREVGDAPDEDAIVVLLAEILDEGVRSRCGSLFLCRNGSTSLAHVFGESAPHQTTLARDAVQALGQDEILHLAARSERELSVPDLRAVGVEVVAALSAGSERVGLVLLGGDRRGRPYGGLDLDFIAGVCSQAATAIHRARVQLENIAHERAAAAGHIAIALAHDTGKDVGWLRRLARRLPDLHGDEERWRRDADAIGDLADELATTYERVMNEASTLRDGHRVTEPRFDDLVGRIARRMNSRYGAGRIAEVIEPAMRGQRFPEFLGRAIGNLVDNALRASPADAPVRLHAAVEGRSARITVEDEGSGIPEEIRSTAFEAGVSTRLDQDGSGVGLTVAAEIVQMLDGTITLEASESGAGTRATVRLPLSKRETPP